MGLPLIPTVFGNRLLPSGPWMSHVKTFGFVILALPSSCWNAYSATSGVTAVVNARCRLLRWAFITSLGAPAVDAAGTDHSACRRAGQRAGLPLDWAFGAPAVEQQAHLAFTRVSSVAELDRRWRRRKVNR